MDDNKIMLALRIAEALGDEEGAPEPEPAGGYAVVRCAQSGVFCGVVDSIDGQRVEMSKARRVHYWAGAASVTELGQRGSAKPGDCKLTAPADRVSILDAIEITWCPAAAEANLRAIGVWTQF